MHEFILNNMYGIQNNDKDIQDDIIDHQIYIGVISYLGLVLRVELY